jgi:hypothetical protein
VNLRKRLTVGAVAAASSIGFALSGAAVIAPADAAQRQEPVLTETDYGYESTAYGTRVTSEVAGLDSTRSAFSYLSCTRLAGRSDSETLASVQLPSDDPYVLAEGIESGTRTYRSRDEDIAGAVTSTNRIAKVRLGNSTTPKLTLNGLRTRSTAWATLDGKLKTANEISSVDISLVDLPSDVPPELQGPLDDLLGAVDDGIGQVVQVILDNGNMIEIPGLGQVSVGFDRQVTHKRFAAASSFVLRVNLFGPDQAAGGGDDSLVGIGRSWARINRDLPAGVMQGVGYGANAQLLDGIVKVGKLGEQPLPCNGTEGDVYEAPVAGIDFASAGQLVASGLRGRSSGEQSESGAASAWTEGSVANLDLGGGSLQITGIVGRANVAQNKAGEIVKNNIEGSSIGEIIVNGESQGAFDPATADEIPPIEIPGVAKIEFFVKEKTNRGMKVSAVVITMLPDTPGLGVVRLGNAAVHIKRY